MAHAVHNSSLSWRRKEESVVFSASTYQPAVLFSFFLLTKLCLYRLPFAFCAFSQMKPPPSAVACCVNTQSVSGKSAASDQTNTRSEGGVADRKH